MAEDQARSLKREMIIMALHELFPDLKEEVKNAFLENVSTAEFTTVESAKELCLFFANRLFIGLKLDKLTDTDTNLDVDDFIDTILKIVLPQVVGTDGEAVARRKVAFFLFKSEFTSIREAVQAVKEEIVKDILPRN